MRRQDMELDYLAPFLAQIGDPQKISRQPAYKLKEDCLADLKQRLIDKANLIQSRFEKVLVFVFWRSFILIIPIILVVDIGLDVKEDKIYGK